MNHFTRLLPSSHIVLDVACSNKKRAFEALAQLFETHHQVARSAAYDALFTREKLGSTGLGEAVAIPHGRVKGLKETLCAVMRLSQAIPFEAPDGKPVQILIALLVPENANQKHLDVLSELAQMLSSPAFRQTLHLATDTAEIHRQFLTWQAHSSPNDL